jgi:hypothetical protein
MGYKTKKPKSTKASKSVAAEMKSAASATTKTVNKKRRDNRANLGDYLFPAKMPSGSKIGAASTSKKTTKSKLLKMRAQKGTHLNV